MVIAALVAVLSAAAPAAAEESWAYCQITTALDGRKAYVSEVQDRSAFPSITYATGMVMYQIDSDAYYTCDTDQSRSVAEAKRQADIANLSSRGFTYVPLDIKDRLKHRLSYFYCIAFGGRGRMLFSDLFINPGWIEPSIHGNNFGRLARDMGGNGYDARCTSTLTPLQYINHLNREAQTRQLVRAVFHTEGKPLGPDVIEDVAAREKYAKLWADPKNLPVPGAEPPKAAQAPVAKPTTQTGSLTIKQDTSIADTKRAWDQQVAKSLAEEAQKKAQLAVKQAQTDTKMKELAEKARLERKKRGPAQ